MASPMLAQPMGPALLYRTIAGNSSKAMDSLLQLEAKSKAAGRRGLKRKHVQYQHPDLYHHTVDWEVLEGEVGAGEVEVEAGVEEEDGAEVEEAANKERCEAEEEEGEQVSG